MTRLVEEKSAGIAILVQGANKLGDERVGAMGERLVVKLNETGVKVRDEVVELLAPSLEGIRGVQTDMRSEISEKVESFRNALTDSDHGLELKSDLKSIAETVESVQTLQTVMRSEAGASREAAAAVAAASAAAAAAAATSIMLSVSGMERALADSDPSPELKSNMEAIGGKVDSIHTAQSEAGAAKAVRAVDKQHAKVGHCILNR